MRNVAFQQLNRFHQILITIVQTDYFILKYLNVPSYLSQKQSYLLKYANEYYRTLQFQPHTQSEFLSLIRITLKPPLLILMLQILRAVRKYVLKFSDLISIRTECECGLKQLSKYETQHKFQSEGQETNAVWQQVHYRLTTCKLLVQGKLNQREISKRELIAYTKESRNMVLLTDANFVGMCLSALLSTLTQIDNSHILYLQLQLMKMQKNGLTIDIAPIITNCQQKIKKMIKEGISNYTNRINNKKEQPKCSTLFLKQISVLSTTNSHQWMAVQSKTQEEKTNNKSIIKKNNAEKVKVKKKLIIRSFKNNSVQNSNRSMSIHEPLKQTIQQTNSISKRGSIYPINKKVVSNSMHPLNNKLVSSCMYPRHKKIESNSIQTNRSNSIFIPLQKTIQGETTLHKIVPRRTTRKPILKTSITLDKKICIIQPQSSHIQHQPILIQNIEQPTTPNEQPPLESQWLKLRLASRAHLGTRRNQIYNLICNSTRKFAQVTSHALRNEIDSLPCLQVQKCEVSLAQILHSFYSNPSLPEHQSTTGQIEESSFSQLNFSFLLVFRTQIVHFHLVVKNNKEENCAEYTCEVRSNRVKNSYKLYFDGGAFKYEELCSSIAKMHIYFEAIQEGVEREYSSADVKHVSQHLENNKTSKGSSVHNVEAQNIQNVLKSKLEHAQNIKIQSTKSTKSHPLSDRQIRLILKVKQIYVAYYSYYYTLVKKINGQVIGRRISRDIADDMQFAISLKQLKNDHVKCIEKLTDCKNEVSLVECFQYLSYGRLQLVKQIIYSKGKHYFEILFLNKAVYNSFKLRRQNSYFNCDLLQRRLYSLVSWKMLNLIRLHLKDYISNNPLILSYLLQNIIDNHLPKKMKLFSLNKILPQEEQKQINVKQKQCYEVSVIEQSQNYTNKCSNTQQNILNEIRHYYPLLKHYCQVYNIAFCFKVSAKYHRIVKINQEYLQCKEYVMDSELRLLVLRKRHNLLQWLYITTAKGDIFERLTFMQTPSIKRIVSNNKQTSSISRASNEIFNSSIQSICKAIHIGSSNSVDIESIGDIEDSENIISSPLNAPALNEYYRMNRYVLSQAQQLIYPQYVVGRKKVVKINKMYVCVCTSLNKLLQCWRIDLYNQHNQTHLFCYIPKEVPQIEQVQYFTTHITIQGTQYALYQSYGSLIVVNQLVQGRLELIQSGSDLRYCIVDYATNTLGMGAVEENPFLTCANMFSDVSYKAHQITTYHHLLTRLYHQFKQNKLLIVKMTIRQLIMQ